MALARLIDLSSRASTRKAVSKSGAIAAAQSILKTADQDDYIKSEAGSLISLLKNFPVTSNVADDKTGSFAKTEIIMPRGSRVYSH